MRFELHMHGVPIAELPGTLNRASVTREVFGSTWHLPNSKPQPAQKCQITLKAELEESGLPRQSGAGSMLGDYLPVRDTWRP